jgi:hypothetical protein
MRTGVEQSRNLMTIRIAEEIGMQTVAGYAERFGVYDRMNPYLANALGAQETTLYQMVAAYAMFANGGERVEPTLVDRVQDRYGRTIYRHDKRVCADCADPTLPRGAGVTITSDRERVMDAITAYQLTSMMEGVIQRGTGAASTCRCRWRARPAPPTTPRTCGSSASPRTWWRAATSATTSREIAGRRLGRRLLRPGVRKLHEEAIKKYGGTKFKVPPGGYFVKIDRFTGAKLPDDASGRQRGGGILPRGRRADLRPGRAGRRRLRDGPEPAAVRLWRDRYRHGVYRDHRDRGNQGDSEEGRFRHGLVRRALLTRRRPNRTAPLPGRGRGAIRRQATKGKTDRCAPRRKLMSMRSASR